MYRLNDVMSEISLILFGPKKKKKLGNSKMLRTV